MTALAALALVGCTPAEPAPVPETSATAVAEVEPSPTSVPAPATKVFEPASTCTEMLGSVLEDEILAGGYTLFSSTSAGGSHYPIASTQSGDPYSCWYGVDGVDLSTFEIAAQRLGATERDGVAALLSSKGFTNTGEGDVATWVMEGDQGQKPAIVHVLRADSWLTAFSAYGGAKQVETLSRYLTTVADQLYR